MGGGSSKQVVDVDVSALAPPDKRPENIVLFSVMPQEGELKKKGDTLLLEVGNLGFRILRPETEDPLALFPWGQIHSWAHGTSKFTFRYFDDGKRTILQHILSMRDVDDLLQHIQGIIDDILAERRKSAITDEAFDRLIEELKESDAATQLDLIKAAMTSSTFTSDQGREVLDVLPTTFDKVEAATVLHSKLIDQNRFSHVLESLDCHTDRENVWHRITAVKKQASGKRLKEAKP
ncbi:hypothetical protein CEUSTIGMA_g8282.t1 [Chlamydomonas eustigma]|uniref:DUF4476 domain-containing protein n=1 Tax=Chlamydomonas eustigma TaxID=1157962 RepID=A0A250XCN2_9CHLO|nr:hypothetical protein CEUSTIGMA_g8282.t1 [Chlamydomonas eustigma]|eukprot:GAX80847.1 hypothetical protein CEUSTIGMA_g8282.t1 [Chlamydomonas eustigma]